MCSCDEFLVGYSDLRDGLLPIPERVRLEQHLHECASCARYDRVLRNGTAEVQRLPEIEPSDDFLFRLQHRILHVEEETRGPGRHGSGVTPALVAMVAALLGVAAWLPAARRTPQPYRLAPAVAVSPPAPVQPVADVFEPLPPLRGRSELAGSWSAPDVSGNALLFSHSPLGRTVNEAVLVRYTAAP